MKADFQFKQFGITDNCCAMKLSTDAVLLGAVTDPKLSPHILDIGTGCGILALMMAQKSHAIIDAVEIDGAAAQQAEQNFRKSKWHDRLNIHHTSIQEYSEKCSTKYDCIICNPPYFQGQLKSPDDKVSMAKHNHSLDFETLSQCANKLLSAHGTFWVILPVSEKNHFLTAFMKSGLYCTKNVFISDKPGKEPHRLISCYSRLMPAEVNTQNLIIKNADGSYSSAYIMLTKDFYLNF